MYVSHPARGVWIEIKKILNITQPERWSHPARGVWIEIKMALQSNRRKNVAPRKGCVD